MKLTLAAAMAVCSVLAFSGVASAEAPKPKSSHLEIDPIVLYGRAQHPTAAVEVAKLPPRLTITETTPRFVDRAERAASRDPF